jgi:hypothetical protein
LQYALALAKVGHPCKKKWRRNRGKLVPIQHIHAVLVHPKIGKGDTSQPPGTDVALSGHMFELMKQIYDKSEDDCDIDIKFRHASDGKQQNGCRDLLTAYLGAPSLRTDGSPRGLNCC